MKALLPYFIFLCLLLLYTCQQNPWKEFEELESLTNVQGGPQARFRVVNNGCFVPCKLRFINESINASSYVWQVNLPDTTLTWSTDLKGFEPEVNYEAAGSFPVNLSAIDGLQKHDTTLMVSTREVTTGEVSFDLANRSCGWEVFQLSDSSYVINVKYSKKRLVKLNPDLEKTDEYVHNEGADYEYSWGKIAVTNTDEVLIGGSKQRGTLQGMDLENHAFFIKLDELFTPVTGEILIDGGNTRYFGVLSITQAISGEFVFSGLYHKGGIPYGQGSTFFASANNDLSFFKIGEEIDDEEPFFNTRLSPTSLNHVIYLFTENDQSRILRLSSFPNLMQEYDLGDFVVSTGPIESSSGNYAVVGFRNDEPRILEIDPINDLQVNEKKITDKLVVIYAISPLKEGGYILTGTMVLDAPNGGWDLYLAKVDTDLNLEWERLYGGPLNEQGWDVKETLDGGFIIVGETKSNNNPNGELYVIKTNYKGEVF